MEESQAKWLSEQKAAESFIEEMKKCFAESAKSCDDGIDGLAVEFADTVSAVRMDSGKRIRRQCVSLAAECLRKYVSCWNKGEPMKSVQT